LRFQRFEFSGIDIQDICLRYPRFQGFEVSKFPRIKASVFQGFKVLRFTVFNVSKFRVLRFLGFEVSSFFVFEVPRNQGFEVFRQSFRVMKFLDFKDSGV
jgi:hypothetical protein